MLAVAVDIGPHALAPPAAQPVAAQAYVVGPDGSFEAGDPADRHRRSRERDVCEGCLSRPIADVLAFCTGEHAGEVKPAAKRG